MPPLPKGNIVVVDVETDGLDPHHGARIFCWGWITNKGEKGFMRKNPLTLQWIQALFNDLSKHVVFHNAKFDLKMFTFEGIDIFNMKATAHCTLILSKLFNGMLPDHSLRWLSMFLLGRKTDDKDEIKEWLQANKKAFIAEHGRAPNFQDAPDEVVQRRALWDVESTLMLFLKLHPQVTTICPELYETERQLMFVVIDMENTGMQVDITHCQRLREQAEKGLVLLQAEIDKLVCPISIIKYKTRKRKDEKYKEPYEYLIESLNTNSSAIELPAAFKKIGIDLLYKTKPKKGKKGGKPTGGGRWSFDEYSMTRYVSPQLQSIMRESGEDGWNARRLLVAVKQTIKTYHLRPAELLPPLIIKLNELQKMISTYYDHILENAVELRVEPSGRIVGILYGSFNQSEAMTGRFSSSHPNFQNMPRILGPRECFIPRMGRRNWHFDYEQVEMKFFVHFTKDLIMAEAINTDIHLRVACEIYHKPEDQITKEQRKRAKVVNFGVIYGSGAETMAEGMTKRGIVTTVPEATIIVGNYHRAFPSVRRIMNEFKNQLFRKGYVENPFGRRYYIRKDKSYTALNYQCQGTSADLIKRAMVQIWHWLREEGLRSKILLTNHDELGIECPPSEELYVAENVVRIMEDHTSFFVPITVDVEVAKRNWAKKEKAEKFGFQKQKNVA